MTGRDYRMWWLGGALVAALLLAMAGAREKSPPLRDSQEAAEAFENEIGRFLDTLPVEREKFEVRVNRCENPSGAMRDDVYAVWIGARLVVPRNDADVMLAELAASWESDGWTLVRNRSLENGGVNIAATEPRAGNTYSLDSGFAPDPRGYVVSYFSTPCFSDPSGTAAFGTVPGQ